MTIKAECKELIRKLIALDMNVIVTARQKALYADAGFMRAIGETFDGEKSLPYLFDSILRLYRDDNGRFMAENLKDRSDKLPRGQFEVSYDRLERAWAASRSRAAACRSRPQRPISYRRSRPGPGRGHHASRAHRAPGRLRGHLPRRPHRPRTPT